MERELMEKNNQRIQKFCSIDPNIERKTLPKKFTDPFCTNGGTEIFFSRTRAKLVRDTYDQTNAFCYQYDMI